MHEFEISIEVNRPLEEVAAFFEDIDNMARYNPAVRSARLTSDGAFGIGSTSVSTNHFLGRDFDTNWEVTDYKANETSVVKSTSGPIEMKITSRLEQTSGGATRVTQHWEADTRGFFKLAEPVITRIASRQMQTSLDTAKELLEAGA